ncbi:MAG: hypothetical protein ACK521_04920 [bacterium]
MRNHSLKQSLTSSSVTVINRILAKFDKEVIDGLILGHFFDMVDKVNFE